MGNPPRRPPAAGVEPRSRGVGAVSQGVAVLMGGWSAEREVSLVERAGMRQGAAATAATRCRTSTSTRDLPALLRAAEPAPRRRLQRAARQRRRGRHDPGRARDAAHPLHPFGRARLGDRDAQADGEDGLRRRRIAARRKQGRRSPRELASGDDPPPPLRGQADRSRARASACASCGTATIRWREEVAALALRRRGAGRTLCPRPRDHGGGDGRARAGRAARSGRPAAACTTTTAKYAPGGCDHLHAGADPPRALYGAALDIGLWRPSRARLPRRQPRRFALRRHRAASPAHGAAGSQHPAGHDADVAGARHRAPCRHRV